MNYIHWNPVRHGIVARPKDYRFSSYNDYCNAHPVRVGELEQQYFFDRVKVFDELWKA